MPHLKDVLSCIAIGEKHIGLRQINLERLSGWLLTAFLHWRAQWTNAARTTATPSQNDTFMDCQKRVKVCVAWKKTAMKIQIFVRSALKSKAYAIIGKIRQRLRGANRIYLSHGIDLHRLGGKTCVVLMLSLGSPRMNVYPINSKLQCRIIYWLIKSRLPFRQRHLCIRRFLETRGKHPVQSIPHFDI